MGGALQSVWVWPSVRVDVSFCLCVGDPHASERIGPSCSRAQAGISLAQLMAALKGADMKMLKSLQDNLRPVIARYHGREFLFDWMLLQIKQAIFEDRYGWHIAPSLVTM